MGTLAYGEKHYTIDDRLLAHLRVVIVEKTRLHEPFLLTWSNGSDGGGGRQALWITAGIPIEFEFTATQAEQLSKHGLNVLFSAAHTVDGIDLNTIPEFTN